MLLAELPGQATPLASDPIRTCEACGKVSPGSESFNIMMQVGVAGHPSIAPFQCPHVEHWACSLDCWRKVAHACIDEHMHELLHYCHAQLNASEEK